MGTLLALISILLSIILYPIGLLMTLIKNLYKQKWKLVFKRLDEQFLAIATSIDSSGNVICKDLFNLALIKKGAYEFGNRRETISSVLGKNERDNTLTSIGKKTVLVLNKIEENHCFNSIDGNL